MNPILTGREVRMNEEYGGRYPLTGRHAPPPVTILDPRTHIDFHETKCSICNQKNRTIQVFADNHNTDMSYYAACGNCGQWDPL